MLTKFHDNTLVTSFIHELLSSTAFPIEKTVQYGDVIVKGVTYIIENCIVTAKRSGLLSRTNFNQLLEVKQPYVWECSYPGLTMTYNAHNTEYSAGTHYYLGQYLRAVRDLKHINLMPLYNCQTDTYLTNFTWRNGTVLTTSDEVFNYLSVPVKLGKTYSIFTEYAGEVLLTAAYIGNTGYLQELTTSLRSVFTRVDETSHFISMKQPFIYSNLNITENALNQEDILKNLLACEKYLRLIIRIPKLFSSSIVVLEGDYSDVNDRILTDTGTKLKQVITSDIVNKDISEETENLLDTMFMSPLSLTYISDNNQYPFADRLLEYLLRNAVTPQDNLSKNIERVQQAASSSTILANKGNSYTSNYTKGVWDFALRSFLYNTSTQDTRTSTKLDLLGYVDKDVEELIFRGVK